MKSAKVRYEKLCLSTPPWLLHKLNELKRPTDKNLQAVIKRLVRESK